MKAARRLLGRLGDLSIRSKLFLSYFTLVLFFLSLSVAVSSAIVVRQNRAQVLRSAEHVFGQTHAYIQYKTESVRTLLYFLTSSPAIQELYERRAEYYRENIGRWPIDAQSFERISYVTSFNPDIVGVTYHMEFGLASVFRNETFIPLSAMRDEEWYPRFAGSERRIHWYVDGQTLHALRGVQDSQNITRITGLIRFDVTAQMVLSPLANALITVSTGAWLADGQGVRVASAGPLEPEVATALGERIRALRGSDFAGPSWDPVTLDGDVWLVGTRAVENTDWVLHVALPNRDIVRMSSRPAQSMVLVLAAVTPLMLLLAYFLSRSATGRIHRLSSRMDSAAVGDFAVTLDPGNTDEIGRLTHRFNTMIAEIAGLIDEKYRLGKEVKNLELRALQAQINPHFLYNTLDLINWMAMRRGAAEIGELVSSLSRFYKLSLGKGEDTAGLDEELDHARAYVRIQNMRYEDAITLQIDVPEPLLARRVPRLILQPLVENAITHGIMMKPKERGCVRIHARYVDERIHLVVDDDGVGMPDDTAPAILSGHQSPTEHHGYGVRNIHERLVLAYGPGFGLSFGRSPEGGTRVTVTLPGLPA